MQVSPIGCYSLNRKQVNYIQSAQRQSTTPASTSLSKSCPQYFSCYNLSFSSSFNLNIIRDMKDMPCLCCGIKMVPFKDYLKILTKKALSGNSSDAVNVLRQFKDNMHPIEKLCFKTLEELSAEDPTKTMQEILIGLRKENLEKLTSRQLEVLNEIQYLGKDLTKNTSNEVKELVIYAKGIILKDNPANLFKRQTFINNIREIVGNIPEEGLSGEIIRVANSLDNSENDLQAFIVKYSRRSSREIGQRLVYPSIKTKEHLVAQNPLEGPNGTSEEGNIAWTCERCNSEEKGNDSILKWANDKPEMCIYHAQRYFDFHTEKIYEGVIPPEYLDTLRKVSKTLINGSNHKIKIDTSKLGKEADLPKKLELSTQPKIA